MALRWCLFYSLVSFPAPWSANFGLAILSTFDADEDGGFQWLACEGKSLFLHFIYSRIIKNNTRQRISKRNGTPANLNQKKKPSNLGGLFFVFNMQIVSIFIAFVNVCNRLQG
ncbi:hypothetical protein ES332_A04G043500v1 [Gossypium tomentosum]|uniref:Secreted protein n=1 Tax=Gossypium tomentosum TaxID=34277 RepID=A0A5D2QUD2_GOSTO|nr:hypothetical protein ES332_A04G043500v1 [Gossypium tomentosum]